MVSKLSMLLLCLKKSPMLRREEQKYKRNKFQCLNTFFSISHRIPQSFASQELLYTLQCPKLCKRISSYDLDLWGLEILSSLSNNHYFGTRICMNYIVSLLKATKGASCYNLTISFIRATKKIDYRISAHLLFSQPNCYLSCFDGLSACD